jgi:hypothetical protein
MIMDPEELRTHIETASRHRGYQARQLTSRILGTCWPGGSEDRIDRAALDWLAFWQPDRNGAALPACSCAAGRCAVCN